MTTDRKSVPDAQTRTGHQGAQGITLAGDLQCVQVILCELCHPGLGSHCSALTLAQLVSKNITNLPWVAVSV
jgi:hypothetical protein